ncbi:hypothetical protein CYMTET_25484, partial [Cymbomonas tetramitiformis]
MEGAGASTEVPETSEEPNSRPPTQAAPPVEEAQRVRVAVMIRPLIAQELVDGCKERIATTPGTPQVVAQTGQEAKSFTFDNVYSGEGRTDELLFAQCCRGLVHGLFSGYNATVLAYGQTGSGKTHTMGTAFKPGGETAGVLPRVMEELFSKVEEAKSHTDVKIRVGFIEILKEDIRDLLAPIDGASCAGVTVREMGAGELALVGAHEEEVHDILEMASCLERGSLCRATAATGMNSRSSRSHAIFTIYVQCRVIEASKAGREGCSIGDSYSAKLQLVDLAGSERAKRTGASGERLNEGIQINKGLLALGNVIQALCDEKKANGHVPYRDSKLTRILQDSLGGNSRTVMVACISPADYNLQETLNTLSYANRARNIRNKPVVNHDANCAEIAFLKQQLSSLRSELSSRDSSASMVSTCTLQETEIRASAAEAQVRILQGELAAAKEAESTAKAAELCACMQRDKLRLKLQQRKASVPEGCSDVLSVNNEVETAIEGLDDGEGESDENQDLIEGYLSTIQALQAEVQQLNKQQHLFLSSSEPGASRILSLDDDIEAGDDELSTSRPQTAGSIVLTDTESLFGTSEDLSLELRALEDSLQAKEVLMRQMSSGDQQLVALKEHYDKKLTEMEEERAQLLKEKVALTKKLDSTKDDKKNSKQAEVHRSKLKTLEEKLSALQKKVTEYNKMVQLKTRSEEAAKRLNRDIEGMKKQRVELLKRMEKSVKDAAEQRRAAQKDLLQARKQARREAIATQKLQAINDKQACVVQRKTEENQAMRKRMLDLEQRRESVQTMRAGSARGGKLARTSTLSYDLKRAEATSARAARQDTQSKDKDKSRLQAQEQAQWVQQELQKSVQTAKMRIELQQAYKARASASQKLLRDGGAPMGVAAEELRVEVSAYQAKIDHLEQILGSCNDEDAAEGEGSGSAVRWKNVHSMQEARAMLKVLFALATSSRTETEEQTRKLV